jgi:hypothetical protein
LVVGAVASAGINDKLPLTLLAFRSSAAVGAGATAGIYDRTINTIHTQLLLLVLVLLQICFSCSSSSIKSSSGNGMQTS